jgi:prepilin-type N-terminal cleavage/methylation domain-containing protein
MDFKTRRASKRPQAGFTLIELLVVVLIIGILAAIAVPQYFKVVEKGRFAEATAIASVLKGAEERYFLKNNAYTTNTALLDVVPPAGKHFTAPAITTVAGPPATFQATIVRGGAGLTACPSYGCYSLIYDGPAGVLSCGGAAAAVCTTDLLP